MKKLMFYWLPPILWMTLIFLMSSQQRIGVSEEFIVNFMVFKFLHIVEYAFLYFLFLRAFRKYLSKKSKRAFLYAAIATLIFAISDEFHQTFTPTRQGSPIDIGIDAIGIGLSFMYTKNNLEKLKMFL